MIFKFLLWILAWRIDSLAKKSEGFKKAMGDYKVVLQFKTKDKKVQRYYAFDNGQTSSKAKVHENPTMSFVFNNPKEALQLIKTMGERPEDKTVFIYAIRDGLLKIEGDMAYLTWFQVISQYFGPEEKSAA